MSLFTQSRPELPQTFWGQKCPSARHRAPGWAREAPGRLAFRTLDPALAAEGSSEALFPPNRRKGHPSAPHTHTHSHAHTNALAVSFSSSFPLGRAGRADKPLGTLGQPRALSAHSGGARRRAPLGPQPRAEAAGPPRPLRPLRAPSGLKEPARPGAPGSAERACAPPGRGRRSPKSRVRSCGSEPGFLGRVGRRGVSSPAARRERPTRPPGPGPGHLSLLTFILGFQVSWTARTQAGAGRALTHPLGAPSPRAPSRLLPTRFRGEGSAAASPG